MTNQNRYQNLIGIAATRTYYTERKLLGHSRPYDTGMIPWWRAVSMMHQGSSNNALEAGNNNKMKVRHGLASKRTHGSEWIFHSLVVRLHVHWMHSIKSLNIEEGVRRRNALERRRVPWEHQRMKTDSDRERLSTSILWECGAVIARVISLYSCYCYYMPLRSAQRRVCSR